MEQLILCKFMIGTVLNLSLIILIINFIVPLILLPLPQISKRRTISQCPISDLQYFHSSVMTYYFIPMFEDCSPTRMPHNVKTKHQVTGKSSMSSWWKLPLDTSMSKLSLCFVLNDMWSQWNPSEIPSEVLRSPRRFVCRCHANTSSSDTGTFRAVFRFIFFTGGSLTSLGVFSGISSGPPPPLFDYRGVGGRTAPQARASPSLAVHSTTQTILPGSVAVTWWAARQHQQ